MLETLCVIYAFDFVNSVRKSDRPHQDLDQHKSILTGLSELNLSRSCSVCSELQDASPALKAALAFEHFLHSVQHGCQAKDHMTNLQRQVL